MTTVFKIAVEATPIRFELDLPDGPLMFDIPPLNYIPRETMAAYRAWVKKASRTASEDDANLKLLELVLDADVYDQVAALPPAVAQQIADRVAEESEATLGESGASTSS